MNEIKVLLIIGILIALLFVPFISIMAGAILLYLSLRGLIFKTKELLGQKSAIFRLVFWIALVILAFSSFAMLNLFGSVLLLYYAYKGLN